MTETETTDIAPLQQSRNDEQPSGDLLTLKEISERLGVAYGRLRGFAETPGVAEYVGAVNVPGVKGVRYPAEAEGQFARLVQAQDAGLVTPKTARAFLASSSVVPLQQLSNDGDGGSIVPLRQSGNGDAVAAMERLSDMLAARLPMPADRLVDRMEAAQLLACKPGAVGRYVRPVRRGAWRHSDVQSYIAGLSQR